MLALCSVGVASAQNVSPGSDVYVKDFVQGDGNTDVENQKPDDGNCEENGSGTNGSGTAGADDCEPNTAVASDCASGADTDPVTGQPCNVETTVASGDLPFTGFEAGLVALIGVALLGGGFAMRRFSRSAPTA